jgi:hypothetical protein
MILLTEKRFSIIIGRRKVDTDRFSRNPDGFYGRLWIFVLCECLILSSKTNGIKPFVTISQADTKLENWS